MSDGQSTPSDYDSISSSVRDDVIISQNVWSPISKTVTSITKPVVFNGVGFDIDENNEYVFPILKASALTHNSDEWIKATGEEINLVGGYQSRLNSWFVFSGSLEMCSDSFISLSIPKNKQYEDSANFNLCMDIINWVFQKKSVIRATNIQHHLNDPKLIQRG